MTRQSDAVTHQELPGRDDSPGRDRMVQVLVLSDLHLEFGVPFVPDTAASAAADIIVLAGDIDKGTAGIAWARQAFPGKPVVYVAGNHEFYGRQWESLIDKLREAGRTYDVHVLEDESVTIKGVRFLGCTLWTDFDYHGRDIRSSAMREAEKRLNDYRLIKAKPLPEVYWRAKPHRLTSHHTLQRHRQSRAWLESELGKGDPVSTVVVTHNYVHPKSTAPEYRQDLLTAAFGSVWPEEVLARANLWIHGHIHTSGDYLVGGKAANARVVCNPRGYPSSRTPGKFENPHFSASLLAQVTTSLDANASAEAGAVLTRALLGSAALLGVEQSSLAKVLGVSEETMARFSRGEEFLRLGSKPANVATLFVRVYQSLSSHVGDNQEQLRGWMGSYNRALDAAPRDAVLTAEGLERTLNCLLHGYSG
jgi:Icc-related predicted phosphoesterase